MPAARDGKRSPVRTHRNQLFRIGFFMSHWPSVSMGVSLPSLLQAAVPSRGFSVHSSHSRWPFLCIPRDLGTMISGIRQSLNPDSEVARALQSGWSGGQHLPANVQKMCSPPHIMSVLHSWLSSQCSIFDLDSGGVSMGRNPSDHQSSRVERPSVSHASGGQTPISPFAADAPVAAPPVPAPPTVSSPFVNPEGRQVSSTTTRAHQEVHPEAGPVRLTRFVDMSLENYYASVSNMVSAGQFEHIGRATIRIDGASVRGVWLRVDHWPSALGRHPRLRCGVLYHVANRTLSFHGIATDAVQFLLHPLRELDIFIFACCGCEVAPSDDPFSPRSTLSWTFSWAIFRQCRSQRSRSPS